MRRAHPDARVVRFAAEAESLTARNLQNAISRSESSVAIDTREFLLAKLAATRFRRSDSPESAATLSRPFSHLRGRGPGKSCSGNKVRSLFPSRPSVAGPFPPSGILLPEIIVTREEEVSRGERHNCANITCEPRTTQGGGLNDPYGRARNTLLSETFVITAITGEFGETSSRVPAVCELKKIKAIRWIQRAQDRVAVDNARRRVSPECLER